MYMGDLRVIFNRI